MERVRIRVREPRRRQHYTFTDRLPEGVTPAEARERVLATLGALIEGAVAR